MSKEVFICYETQTGLDYAIKVKEALKKTNLPSFVAFEDIEKGEKWKGAIDDAIKGCKYFIVIITTLALVSEEVKREIRLAGSLPSLQGNIIPCKEKGINREWLSQVPEISDFQQIDFDSKEELVRNILNAIANKEGIETLITFKSKDELACNLILEMTKRENQKVIVSGEGIYINGQNIMHREKLTDLKFCIDRESKFSKKLSDYFEKGKALPFKELWKFARWLELTDEEKPNYDIIEFSFVIQNNEDKPLFIERLGKAHRITTGVSILQSCSPVSTLGSFPRSIDDIKSYFEQEVEIRHPKTPDYKINLLGIAKNVRKGINYYFYIFRVKFSVKEPTLSLRTEPDVILGFYDPNSKRQSLKDKKVDLRVLKVLFQKFEEAPEDVKGCILHKEVNNNFHDMLFTTQKT